MSDKTQKPGKPGAKPTAPKAAEYEMPAVAVGDTVLWNPGVPSESDEADVVGIVTAVNTETVNVATLRPGTYNFDPMEGVRHADHPNRSAIASSEVGTWRHRPSHLALLARIDTIETLFDPAPKAT